MNIEKTALVLIELQNDFLSDGGKLHAAVKEIVDSNNLIENTNNIIKTAREKGMRIIHVPILFSKNRVEAGANPFGILKIVKDSDAFLKGSWGGDISEAIDLHANDIIIDGKSGICGFSGTNLDFILRSHGIETIALGGLLTNVCIESTMRSAYNNGYEIYTLTDCMATIGKEQQEFSIEHNLPMFSKPVTNEEFNNLVNES